MTPLPRAKWYIALPCAVVGGLLLDLAAPDVAWWAAAILGVLLVLAAVWQQRAGRALCYGAVAGAAFWMPHIKWLTLYLGPVPWLGLCGVMIVWFALFGLLSGLATRGLGTLRAPRTLIATLQSLVIAGLWVAREQVQSSWPYGGFDWGRVAHAQVGGPFSDLAAWVGIAGLSGLVVFGCALLLGGVLTVRALRARSLVSGMAAVLFTTIAFVPVYPLESTGNLRVAAVQGNSKSGIFDDRENGDVFRAHVDATEELLDRLDRTGDSVDVIVWPENSAEFQIPEQVFRVQTLRALSARANAPIVVGSVLQDPDGTYTNSSLVFDAQGDTGVRYDKRRPVPFAEYMPHRAFFHALAPDLVDLVQLEYAFGQRPTVLPINTSTAQVLAGIAICFDVVFDDHAVAMAKDGAELILAQTNNADFGRTDESAQQLQIARLRAIEMGRALVNVSTVGISALALPDGSLTHELRPFTPASFVADVPLYRDLTPALRFGSVIAGAFITTGVAGAVIGTLTLRLSKRARPRA